MRVAIHVQVLYALVIHGMLYTDMLVEGFAGRSVLTSVQTNCNCSGAAVWVIGVPFELTSCYCDISDFPGVDGLNVGELIPAYGTIMKFGNAVALTQLDDDMSTGFSNQYTTQSAILSVDASSTGAVAVSLKLFNVACGRFVR